MLDINIYKKLSHFDLHVQLKTKQERVVLFGPSGSGKTTVLNCIAGILHPDEGHIRLKEQTFFDSEQKRNKPTPIQNRNLGYLFQDYALFPHMTVKQNIAYGMKDSEIVKDLIEVVGIEHLLQEYPSNISGGEKQRVALVRALATRPNALLLDEPFSALDEKTRRDCQDELLRIHDMWNIPILIVTHNLEEARKLGHRILRINQGKIVH
ncbi:MAG TPA: ATP-binding cassette domain-containing protein [Cerasibacillus sp.]|uniref:ATP-binding cassette domain-containing protein n=1 Tax=Cerasibacillus sp. TaxID=2498711 RepID=UPI002F3E5370